MKWAYLAFVILMIFLFVTGLWKPVWYAIIVFYLALSGKSM